MDKQKIGRSSKSDSEEEDPKISLGFDRGLEFKETKNLFINEFEKIGNQLDILNIETTNYVSQRRILIHKLIYLLISMMQLRNGSRISESCDAFKIFMVSRKFDKPVLIKIAKSECTKYKKDTGEAYKTKKRYRKMKFPSTWLNIKIFEKYSDDMK